MDPKSANRDPLLTGALGLHLVVITKNVLVIASGGNVDKDIFENCLSQQEI